MSLLAIETVVREQLGLDPAALGPSVLPRAIETRTRLRGLSLSEYTATLVADPFEREALASELVVPESWFFRGGVLLFERLATFIANRSDSRSVGNPVRVLCVPCSAGEEPYSLAIALHERLIGAEDCTIDAIDLSGRNLERAGEARYSAFAFREPGPDIRASYFRPDGDQWELLPRFRACVQFFPGNLTDALFLERGRPYDLILCRNLFIYLTSDGRQRAMINLDRLLALDGRLCLTPAEADRLPPGRFLADGPTESGIYRRVGGTSSIVASVAALQGTREPPIKHTPIHVSPHAPEVIPVRVPLTLEGARLLADAGRLSEAQTACEQLLRADSKNADALALLGIIHLAAGRAVEAHDALRKALYLEPEHLEALSHMIVLAERRGDAGQAAALRRRLARARKEDA
ncbi:MAG: hypothetical protein L0241_15900 [Planctomycetia bacterium]|nr:hypothetical protein [Planctomycetia bacterium]